MSDDQLLLREAVARDPAACRQLVSRLTPIVRHRVTRVMALHECKTGRSFARQDVLDRIQDVFVLLLDQRARVLRTWDPAKGLSLDNFVGLVAERETQSMLKSGRRSAWAEHATNDDSIARHVDPVTPEARVSSARLVEAVLDDVESQLSPRGLLLLDALLVQEEPLEEISRRFAMSANAIYSFRSRLKSLVAAARLRLEGVCNAPTETGRMRAAPPIACGAGTRAGESKP